MNDNEINDKRNPKDFKGITFSQFKKNDVRKELLNNLINGKMENSNYWAAEFICAGHYMDLWEIILFFMSKHIHLGNPRLSIYLDMRFDNFKEIVNNGYIDNELRMRNNEKIRRLFCEIISILCDSPRKHGIETVKIKSEEFDITSITYRLKAPNVHFIQPIFQKGDPKELFIALNELAYHISTDSKKVVSACYWVEWILEFEAVCTRKKIKCLCERRSYSQVATKFQMDIIWIIWDLFHYETSKRSKLIKKIIQSNFNLFALRYSPGVKRKRRYLIYFTIALLTENCDFKTEIINNKEIVDSIIKRVNIIYKQIKKNEISPATSYLFNNNIAKTNLENTVKKLEKMSALSNLLPRS